MEVEEESQNEDNDYPYKLLEQLNMQPQNKLFLHLLKQPENQTELQTTTHRSKLLTTARSDKKSLSENNNKRKAKLNDELINLVHANETAKSTKLRLASKKNRKELDTYAESLLFVNRIYNTKYGFERRRVPAHMPHLIDKRVVVNMQTTFESEFFDTSSHRVRHPMDMQFAFSYFYYLTSETMDVSVEDIFDLFDTDRSRFVF